jgi:CDP-diglyceride synthetase
MASTTPKKAIWSDLPRRAATICIGFPIVWKTLSNSKMALIFFVCVHGLVTWEYTLLEPKKEKPSTAPNLQASFRLVFCVTSLLSAHIPIDSLFHLVLCCIVGVFTWLDRRHWILGMIFVTIPFRAWYFMSQDFASTISILLVVWNCDTGALLFGRLSSKFGIRKISVPAWIHKISPAKSMEGFIGGILGGTWTAVFWIPRLVDWFHIETSTAFDVLWGESSNRLTLGISMSILAIFGDLVESSIKRQSQTKDSGSVLPGHGGILDRFDSSLLAVLLYSFLLDYITSQR